jgi:deoxycytidine triphosphate deaminase
MIIGTKRLIKLVNNPSVRLVEGLCKRERENPEGEGFDLRVGEIYYLQSQEAFLGVTERSTPEIHRIASYNESSETQEIIGIQSGDYRLIKTIEKINLPNKDGLSLSAVFTPRTTLQRSGMILITSNASPGYSGELTFGLYNASHVLFRLQLGARIATAIFHETTPNLSSYRGQWQGGRVSTQGNLENQI